MVRFGSQVRPRFRRTFWGVDRNLAMRRALACARGSGANFPRRTRPARVVESARLTGWSGYCSTTALTFAMAARLVRRAGESAKARAKAAERRMATRYRLTNAWEGAAVMRSLTARVRGEDCQQWSDGPMLLTREAQVQPTAAGSAPSNSMSHP